MTHKKKCLASTRAHDPFFDILKIWPTFIYRGEVPSNTFAKLPVHALINDPKQMFRKKLYVTIPQWFETFPNMSDLWPGRNGAKCGLQLNDPIDWLKLRLSQPKIELLRMVLEYLKSDEILKTGNFYKCTDARTDTIRSWDNAAYNICCNFCYNSNAVSWNKISRNQYLDTNIFSLEFSGYH